MLLRYSVGIDIGYKHFHVCIVVIDNEFRVKVVASRKFENTNSGHKLFREWYKKNHKDKSVPMHFCMEATGVYHENLAHDLHSDGQRVSILLANYSCKYLESMGLKTKNDKNDARGLAQMGAVNPLRQWNPPVKFYAELRSLTRHYQCLQELKTAENNRLHAMRVGKEKSKIVLQQLEQHLKQLKKQITKMEVAIKDQLEQDKEVSRKVSQICAIKGVGQLTVAVVIAETYGFELFENAKQVVSYAGYDVVENQSGQRSGKTKISKKGNSRIRRAMHMPAFSARKYEESFGNLYDRTFEKHKIKMKSYVAIQRKLLTTMYALWKKDEAFDSNYFKKMEESFEGRKEKIVAPLNAELLLVQNA